MFQIPLVSSATTLSRSSFWSSLLLYHDRPHLVNRKLAAVTPVLFCELHGIDSSKFCEIFRREALIYEIQKLDDPSEFTIATVHSITEYFDKNISVSKRAYEDIIDSSTGVFLSLRILLGRQKGQCYEIVLLDKCENTATFFAVQESISRSLAPVFPYRVGLNSGNLHISVNSFEDADTSSAEWLTKLYDKLFKWAENDAEAKTNVQSLSLISPENYCKLYNDLKIKYSTELLEKWTTMANTDPKKYIFEDLAIAAYLICFWQQNRIEPVNFVDCGCGNGLLVYILNMEGYKGRGVDLRSRKIWSLFSSTSNLSVETVTPSSLFPESTWIIGNHSDELTPWIPVIALRSSPKTNFFVLPCCAYDFSGQKYVRTNTAVSQYCDYMSYVESICNKCGFDTRIDKLRIPSTKRTCLVGIQKDNDFEQSDREITTFIDSRLNRNFVARNPVEKVRNCTQLDKSLRERIVKDVVASLLKKENFIGSEKKWNRGGEMRLADLVTTVGTNDLKMLKSECGGLQTLLKNHRYVFKLESGLVSIREPPRKSPETVKYNSKPCWFSRNHPDGCLWISDLCCYQH